MPSINNHLAGFTNALNQNQRVVCSKEGEWKVETLKKYSVKRIFASENDRIVGVGEQFNSCLDQLENIPVKFNAGSGTLQTQKETYDRYLGAAKAVRTILGKCGSKKAKEQRRLLDVRIIGLRFRIERANDGLDPLNDTSNQDREALEKMVKDWKKSHDLYENTSIEGDKEKIEEILRYPEFVALLDLDKTLRESFFNSVIRDDLPVREVIEYPAMVARLETCLMAGRVGRYGADMLVAKKQKSRNRSGTKKVLTLPFEVEKAGKLKRKRISILKGDRKVTFKNGYEVTIDKVFKVFQDRDYKVGRVDTIGVKKKDGTMGGAIANWHAMKLGSWNPKTKKYERVDLSPEKSKWWEQLPPAEQLTKDQLIGRLDLDSLKDGQWVTTVKSTTQSNDLDVDQVHGYLEVYIPQSDGTYYYYPYGKFAKDFPQTLWDTILILLDTVEARFMYPDENHNHSHRLQAAVPFAVDEPDTKKLTEADGVKLMEDIRKDIVEALRGNMVFQFSGKENCANWGQQKLENLLGKAEDGGNVPNFFRAPLFEATPNAQPLKSAFKLGRKLPRSLQRVIVRIFEFVFMSWRGIYVVENGKRVFKSIARSPLRKNIEMYHPAKLHDRIKRGEIKGTIHFGNRFAKQN